MHRGGTDPLLKNKKKLSNHKRLERILKRVLNGGVANTQPDFDCAKTLFDSYITIRSRSDRLNVNDVTDGRVTGKWFFLLPY